MIEIQNLTKKFGQITAVDNLNFTVEKGEILGFLGPNGAGKTTTMNIITGYLSSTEGTVKVCGHDIVEEPLEAKRHLGYLPEHPPLYTDMTVREFLYFVSELKKVNRRQARGQIRDIMELVGITHVSNRLVNNLSKGYKQRVGLAQALIGSPDVLILDEPTVGLDPIQIIEIRKLIKALGGEHTIILSTHILPEVSFICKRVVIINKGRIAAIDTPENLSQNLRNFTKFTIKIEGPDSEVAKLLKSVDGVQYVELAGYQDNVGSYVIESSKDVDVRRPVFHQLSKHSYPILELRSYDMSLEDIFLQITTEEKEVV